AALVRSGRRGRDRLRVLDDEPRRPRRLYRSPDRALARAGGSGDGVAQHADAFDLAFDDVADLEGAGRVHEITAAPWRAGQLHVACGDVVADRIAEHVVERSANRDVSHPAPDDHAELDLPIDLPRQLDVHDDRVVRPGDARRELREDERLLRLRQLRLADVVAVVEPDRDDLPGLERRGEFARHRIPDGEVPRVDAGLNEREEVEVEVEAPIVA